VNLSTHFIAAVYCQPRHNLKEEHFAAFFQTLGPRFLAGGDFNSKHTLWGSRLITTKGRELAKIMQTNNYSFLSTGSPTYWPADTNKIPDLLDFFITNGIATNYAEVEASYDLTSDHSPIITTIRTTVMIRQPPPRLHTSQTCWDT
jgi:endonuclease/exonuclease/phosphatase (EEP) superfamily protein YafD